MTCDWCRLMNVVCPGTEAHCIDGDHCCNTDAACAASFTANDPCNRCCHCHTTLPTRNPTEDTSCPN